jgi:hypothetical protein
MGTQNGGRISLSRDTCSRSFPGHDKGALTAHPGCLDGSAGLLAYTARPDNLRHPKVNLRSSKTHRVLATAMVIAQSFATTSFAQSAAPAPSTVPTSASASTTAAQPPSPFTPALSPTLVPLPLILPVPIPTTVPPPAPEPPPGIDVHFDANEEQVALLVGRDGPAGAPVRYGYVCIAPCDARLLPGPSRMALSLAGDHPIEVKEPVVVAAATTLRGTYRSRGTIRGVGVAVLIAGVVAGSMIALGGASTVAQDATTGWAFVVGGSTTALAAAIIGAVFCSKKDETAIEIVPQTVSRIRTLPGFANESVTDPRIGEGVELRVRF